MGDRTVSSQVIDFVSGERAMSGLIRRENGARNGHLATSSSLAGRYLNVVAPLKVPPFIVAQLNNSIVQSRQSRQARRSSSESAHVL